MTRISHDPTDDDAASTLINQQLRRPDAATWAALCDPDRAEQTWRVLKRAIEVSDANLGNRKSDIERERRRRANGEITTAEYEQHLAEYEDWKARALTFRALARQYSQRVYATIARQRGHDMVKALRQSLKQLTAAVVEHRAKVEEADLEPTDFDRLLWARLGTIRVPGKSVDETVTLAEHLGIEDQP